MPLLKPPSQIDLGKAKSLAQRAEILFDDAAFVAVRAHGCNSVDGNLVRSTHVINETDAADKSFVVSETVERCVQENARRRIIGLIIGVVVTRRDDDEGGTVVRIGMRIVIMMLIIRVTESARKSMPYVTLIDQSRRTTESWPANILLASTQGCTIAAGRNVHTRPQE
jgi:hypothetical protein